MLSQLIANTKQWKSNHKTVVQLKRTLFAFCITTNSMSVE